MYVGEMDPHMQCQDRLSVRTEREREREKTKALENNKGNNGTCARGEICWRGKGEGNGNVLGGAGSAKGQQK